jgi:hypothetical protein
MNIEPTFTRRAAVSLLLAASQVAAKRPSNAIDYRREDLGGGARVSVPAQWSRSPAADGNGFSFADPVSGQAMRHVAVTAAPTSAASTKDLGRIELVDFVKALGLRPELARADMVAAALRQGEGGSDNGSLYYEWDLALAPKTCAAETQYLVGSCPYDQVEHPGLDVGKGVGGGLAFWGWQEMG